MQESRQDTGVHGWPGSQPGLQCQLLAYRTNGSTAQSVYGCAAIAVQE